MKSILPYIIGFIVGVLLCVILWENGCNKKPGPDHSSDKKSIDSIAFVMQQHDQQNKYAIDSLSKKADSFKNDKDSLTAIIVSYEKNLAKQSNDIGELIADLNDAEAQKDTLRTLNRCDSLRDAVINAKAVVGYYIFSNDSLRKVNDEIIATKTEIANRLNQQLIDCNNGFFQTQLKYSQLYADYKKINTKPKRFSIGPFVGAGIMGGQIKVIPGIGITYSLIRF